MHCFSLIWRCLNLSTLELNFCKERAIIILLGLTLQHWHLTFIAISESSYINGKVRTRYSLCMSVVYLSQLFCLLKSNSMYICDINSHQLSTSCYKRKLSLCGLLLQTISKRDLCGRVQFFSSTVPCTRRRRHAHRNRQRERACP